MWISLALISIACTMIAFHEFDHRRVFIEFLCAADGYVIFFIL